MKRQDVDKYARLGERGENWSSDMGNAHTSLAGMTYHYSDDQWYEKKGPFPVNTLSAKNDRDEAVGHLRWRGDTGEILHVYVHQNKGQQFRRLGVGTELFERAKRLSDASGMPQPRHSKDLTTHGRAWAEAVGGRIPRNARTVE